MHLHLLLVFALCALVARPAQAQTPAQAESDSLLENTEGVKKHYMRPGGPPTLEEEKEKFFRQLRERGKPPLEPHTARGDSLVVKEMHRPFDIENAGLRILAKVAVGTFSGIASTGVVMGVLDRIYEPYGDPDADAYREIGFSLFGAIIGCSAGFPLGISSVDPYDSLPKTLLAGVIPGAVGIGLIWAGHETGFLIAYVFPVISSLAASESSRQSLSAELKSKPQSRRISFVLVPTLNGGLSTVATLRF